MAPRSPSRVPAPGAASGGSGASWFRGAPSFARMREALSTGGSSIASAVKTLAGSSVPPAAPLPLAQVIDGWSKQPGVTEAQAAEVSWVIGSGMTFGVMRAKSATRLDVPSLPDVFDRIPDLTEVHLHDNFGPELPPSVTASTNLETLDVSNSRIRRLPQDLGSMAALTTLDVRRCPGLLELPASVDPSRIRVIADPGSAIEERILDRLYERTASPASRAALTPRIQDAAARMAALQGMRSSGQIGEQAWRVAQDGVSEESMKGSDTLSGKGLAMGGQVNMARQSYLEADRLAASLAASGAALTVADLLAVNGQVGRGGTYHPNITEHGDGYGSFRSGRIAISDQQGDELQHPDPSRVPALMQDLVDKVNLESARLDGSGDVFAKVELAASAAAQLLSIHPFPDGNGRTAYLLMSQILQRHGLPPVAMPPDARLILHPGLGSKNPSADDLVASAVSGMERSLAVLEASLASASSRQPG